MHRNTLIFVCLLAVVAALVVGVRIGQSVRTSESVASQTVSPSPPITPTVSFVPYESSTCGVAFSIPKTFRTMQAETGGTMFINTQDPVSSVTLLCQKSIPLTLVASESAEPYRIGSVSATIYRHASGSSRTMDTLIFTNPATALQTMIAAPGTLLSEILNSLSLR